MAARSAYTAAALLVLVVAGVASAVDLQAALKMAQCRAHCLDKFLGDEVTQHEGACHRDTHCYQCWESCEMLATNFPIWSLTCGQHDICDEGCDASCDFHAAHPRKVVPLSQHNSRLTLVFSGTAAQWSLSWGRHSTAEHVVFALFTRSPGKPWELRLQTADFGASLDDLSSGSDMKLVAVAESGVLSVIITPYAPPAHPKGIVKPALGMPLTQATHARPESNGIDAGEDASWPLLHEAEVEASGLVAARVWWPPLSPRGADYLVTWEVEGGGLKGHLYTDLTEVDLTLWPETVYQVRVEVMAGPLGQPLRSAHLTLDTHNITLAAHARKNNRLMPTLPLVHKAEPPVSLEMVLGAGAGVLAALLLLAGLVWRRARAAASGHAATATPAKWGTWNRTLADVTLDESLVVKGSKAAEGEATFPAASRAHQGPVFTLAPPAHPGPSLLSFTRPAHTHVNLYSVVPPPQEHRGQVTNI